MGIMGSVLVGKLMMWTRVCLRISHLWVEKLGY